jgi:hypothetical protein
MVAVPFVAYVIVFCLRISSTEVGLRVAGQNAAQCTTASALPSVITETHRDVRFKFETSTLVMFGAGFTANSTVAL